MDITWKRKWIFWLLLAVMLLFLPGKTFAAEKESKDADDLYTYHTAFDAKASLKIRHMKDYGVLDYEETVEVEDSCDYLDGNEDLDVIQAKIAAYDAKVQKVCEGMQVVSGTDTRGIDGDTINIEYENTEKNGQMVTTRHFYQTYKIRTDWVLEKMEISDVNIVNSTLSCYAGDAPKATAQKDDSDASKYEIAYERWEKMEADDQGNLSPVAFWYSDESQYTDATPRFTTFEKGATYLYSLFLKTVDGNEFSKDLSLTLNGKPADSRTVIVGNNGTTCFADALYSVKSEEKVTPKPIEVIEVNGVDFSFKAGDAPRFTGSVSEDALYCIDHERWNSLKEGWTSSDYWNGRYGDFDGSWGMPLTKFKALETYYYGICLSLSARGYREGYYFDKNITKLKINDRLIPIPDPENSFDETGETVWFSGIKSIVIPPQGSTANGSTTNPSDTSQTFPKTGTSVKTKDALYKVTKADATGCTVTLVKPHRKTNSTFTVPATIKSEDGKITFRVTEISKNAFKNHVKLKKVIIGKNVGKIGANAFSGCKKLKNIKITSTQLTKKSVGKNVFKGIDKKAVIKVPKKKLKAYKSIFKGKGQAKSVKIKK